MSLPDHLLDLEEDLLCAGCRRECDGALCAECQAEVVDLYADEAIQDRLEGRRQ